MVSKIILLEGDMWLRPSSSIQVTYLK